MTTIATVTYDGYCEDAKRLLRDFLQTAASKWDLRCKCRVWTDNMSYILESIKMQASHNRGKLVYLQVLFDRETDVMIGELLKKNRHQQHNKLIMKM